MNNTILYFITVVSWSFTWLAIQFQLGVVPPTWSVAYRFGWAGIILLIYCIIVRRPLKFSLREHTTMFLQGGLLFSINFLMFYMGSQYLISGVAAVIFATITAMNILNARIFFKTPITLKLIVGTFLGFLGLTSVFWSQISLLLGEPEKLRGALLGLVFCLFATLIASLGNMLSKYNQQRQLPILQNNAISMVYGGLVTSIVAILFNQPLAFDWSLSYTCSLLYLCIIGTIVGFGCYLKLLGNIGPERASYVFVIVPVIAMIISTFVEGFHWQLGSFIGITLVVLGNYLVLAKASSIKEMLASLKEIKTRKSKPAELTCE